MTDKMINSEVTFDLHQEIAAASSIEQLQEVTLMMPKSVMQATKAGFDIKSSVRLISSFNDAVTLRLIELLESEEGIALPPGASFLVLGSEGRGEQTLRTDQDNAVVYADNLSRLNLRNMDLFAFRLVDALEEIGVPRCPGNIMASNPHWCHSISEWKVLLDRWINIPTPENILNFSTFQDLRTLHGNPAASIELCGHICAAVRRNYVFFPNMAGNVVRFPSPFTIFGNIRVEHGGEHAGSVDLKKTGIFAITTGTSLLALECGIIGGDTWRKLELLGEAGFFSATDLETVLTAFTFLVYLRLQQQLRDLSAGCIPTNYVDPKNLSAGEYEHFRQALKGVNSFLWIFRNHYMLDYV